MSSAGSTTRAAFKKAQLDHVIDIILEADGDPDHVFHRIADFYPVDNVQDYVNIDKNELDIMNLTKSTSNEPLTITHFIRKESCISRVFGNVGGIIPPWIGLR